MSKEQIIANRIQQLMDAVNGVKINGKSVFELLERASNLTWPIALLLDGGPINIVDAQNLLKILSEDMGMIIHLVQGGDMKETYDAVIS